MIERILRFLARAPGRLRRTVDLYLRPRLRFLRLRDAFCVRFLPFLRSRDGSTLTVFRRADVVAVLSNSDDFSVRASGARMDHTIGAFFLGMDPGAQYAEESGAMRAALMAPDPTASAAPGIASDPRDARLAKVERAIAELAQGCVKRALLEKGQVDVVADLADRVPLRFARRFFGVHEPADGERLLRWFRAPSSYVFGVGVDALRGRAEIAGATLRSHVRAVVEAREADLRLGKNADDVLGRLLAARRSDGFPSNDVITRCLVGTMSGAIIPAGWLFIEAVDRLMRLPRRERERLHLHARTGNRLAVRAYVLEAARFFPFPPVLLRHCPRGAQLGGRRIAPGTTVVAAISAAAADPNAVPRPWRFLPGRPDDQLLLFGHGTHLCQGQAIGEILLTEMTLALFARPGLRRARGFAGRLDYEPRDDGSPDGPYPKHLILEANGWSA